MLVQENVRYDDLEASELEAVVANLTERLDLAKAALAAKTGDAEPAAAEPAARKAEKVEGDWPELPWGRERCPQPPSRVKPPDPQ